MALRVLYVFTARKRGLVAAVGRGEAPDTLLFGLNHLHRHGALAEFYEPEYGTTGRAVARALGRLGPDVLQLRTLPRFSAYDVVFLTGGWPLLLAAQLIPPARRPKLVWLNMTLTNLLRRGGALARCVRAAIARADRVVCVAQAQQRFLQQEAGLPAARVSVALSGTDVFFYDPDRAADQAERGAILAAGRDAARDYRTLFAAVEHLQAPTRVVCSPRNVDGLTVPRTVTLRYDIPQTALRAEYHAARSVAIPTLGDGSTAGSDCSGTLVLLDALAMGKPAVITERASVADYVTPGQHVRTVRPEAAAGLADELAWMEHEPGAAGEMARAGQARVRDALTTAHFAERIASVLHELASSA